MKKHYALTFTFILFCSSLQNLLAQNEIFSMRQLACELSQPWEIKFGPDGYLWVTEAHTYQIRRIDPVTGDSKLMLDLAGKKNFPDYNEADEWPQGGLTSFAFHNDFHTNPYFYVAYVYRFDGCLPDTMGCYFKTRIVRYNFNVHDSTFSNETIIADTLPGSNDHNGGRLVVSPVTSNMNNLFYSVGDMGSGHLDNRARPHLGQNINSYEGKILRYNLVADNDTSVHDKWIPNDNPFNANGRQSAVWSLGHRNPQGLVFSPEGILYESEHGPYSDDEVNIIRRGYNYGFPLIMGFADGNYDNARSGAGSGAPPVISELNNKLMIEQTYPYSDPIASFFAASKAEVTTIYNNDYNNTPPFPNYYLQWPSVAPSGIEYYSSDAIPGWKNSILMANLKAANVYRLKLNATGTAISSDTIVYFQGMGRFRDIALSADGKKIYVSTDSIGSIKGAPGESVIPPNRGCILEFTFLTTANEDPSSSQLFVYPNPTENYFTITLPEEVDNAKLLVNSMSGQVKINSTLTDKYTDIHFNDLQSGIYLVQIIHDKKIWSEKLIVK